MVLERTDAVTWLSLRNAPEVHIVAVDQLNTYDVVASDDVVFTQGAFDAFVNGTAAASDRSASLAEDAEAEEKPAKKDAKKADAKKADADADAEDKPAKKAAAKKTTAKKTAAAEDAADEESE